MKKGSSERRKYLRFNPSTLNSDDLEKKSLEAVAHIDLNASEEKFESQLVGFVMEKSHSGCSLLILTTGNCLQKDAHCYVKVGPLHPLLAIVRWCKKLDDQVIKVGLEFLE